ncbi:hypothetical protein GMORB2_7609 [Geosmithia morbida]|uniref:Uncharacterized protein n=1 Tax=Geosmithia morbida TaxID=1094350 RepID=A0A9P4YRY1_9HYPO|nr:uncharacterized protein GMORB2_7609 [Geosmithia morbida]KAF4122016.1 hypothetical protein GMORB2_7609 [Geosmithia morbida]
MVPLVEGGIASSTSTISSDSPASTSIEPEAAPTADPVLSESASLPPSSGPTTLQTSTITSGDQAASQTSSSRPTAELANDAVDAQGDAQVTGPSRPRDIGIVIGTILSAVILIVIFIFLYRRRQRIKEAKESSTGTEWTKPLPDEPPNNDKDYHGVSVWSMSAKTNNDDGNKTGTYSQYGNFFISDEKTGRGMMEEYEYIVQPPAATVRSSRDLHIDISRQALTGKASLSP